MSERRAVRVGDVAQVVGGGTPKTGVPEYWDGGLPWATPKDLSRSPVKWFERGMRDISSLGVEKSSVRKVPQGTVLLTSRAPVGLVSLAARPVYTNQGFKSLILDDSQDPEYWYYLLKMSTDYLEARASGSTFKELNGRAVADLSFSVHPLDEQRRIAAVLGAFDDLIETNQSLTDDLVMLAQRSLACADWPSQRVGDVAVLNRGLSYKGSGLRDEATDECTPMINLANFTKSGWIKTAGTKLYAEPFKPAHVLARGDLVIANTDLTQAREILGRGVLVSPEMEGAIHSHHTTSIRFPENPLLALFLWAQLQTPSFRERALGYATGTTVTALPKEAVLEYTFHVPEDWEQMAEVGQALLTQAWACEAEIADLTRTRDELLPLLMSGRVRVEDVEGMV